MRAGTWAIAAIAVVGLGAGATPSAARDAESRCISEAARAGVLSADTKPGTANFIGGTDGDDRFPSDQLTHGVDVVCGFGGNDVVETLSHGDIFLGGPGDDRVIVNGGTFYGGEGNDSAISLHFGGTFNGGIGKDGVNFLQDGTFNGGVGNDSAEWLDRGTFNGGEGTDGVEFLDNGTFNGGEGNDSVHSISFGGTFNGGPGDDSVTYNGGSFNQD